MRSSDLALVEHWMSAPHVAQWYLAGSTLEREIGDVRDSLEGRQPVHALVAVHGESAIGWCQWYLCKVDAAWAADVGAGPGDVGIDYAIGEPALVGHGVGTRLVGDLVRLVQSQHPGCAVLADPDERNTASRRVLEKNGFELVAVRSLPSEPTDDPVAIYRLAGPGMLRPRDRSRAPAAGVDERARTEPRKEDT
jgi:aminoglycoside 6'-N-acetyltransferase